MATKSVSPMGFEQTIPVSLVRSEDSNVMMVRARVTAIPMNPSDQSEDVSIDFDNSNPEARDLIKSQAWEAALGGALASQQPWSRVHWLVSNVPGVDGPASATSLALGFIAVTSRIPYPSDTLVLATLYPDTSVGPVNQIMKRINAAKGSGIRRIVFSSLQRFEVVNGSLFNVAAFTKDLGIEPVFVESLAEASERVLNKGFPVITDVRKPSLSADVSGFLDQACRKEMTEIQRLQNTWPKDPNESTLMNSHEKLKWNEVLKNYNAGVDAYRAGQLYISHEKFSNVNAELQTISALHHSSNAYAIQPYVSKAGLLRKRISDLASDAELDKNELQSALLVAEKNQWLFSLDSRLEGAQFLAQQAFNPRSQATLEQKDEASYKLMSSVQEVEFLLKNADFYRGLSTVISHARRAPVEARVRTWLPQLTPIYLAAAEFLPHGLEKYSNIDGEKLILDDRLVSEIRLLHDTRETWNKQELAFVKNRQPSVAGDAQVGFVPGSALSATPLEANQSLLPRLSDTARILNWANQYCEVVTLQRKYLGYDDLFSPEISVAKNKGALQNMLQIADVNAKSGISLAERGGIDPSVLVLMYQKASYLKDSLDTEDLLEATRYYWRCSLLGNLCWQLSYKTVKPPPTIVAESKAAPTDDRTAIASANPGVPRQAAMSSIQTYSPVSESTNVPLRTKAPVDSLGENSLASRELPVPSEPKVNSDNSMGIPRERFSFGDTRPPSVPALPVILDDNDQHT